MDERVWGQAKTALMIMIVGIVLTVVGLGAASIGSGIVNYILGTLNGTGITIPSIYNFLKQASPLLGTAATFTGITLIVIAASVMIFLLWQSIAEVRKETGA